MGAHGPQPTPTSLLMLRGSKYRAARREGEPVDPVKAPVCPSGMLGPEGLREWKRIVPLLVARKTLAEADRAMLTVYCQAWEDFYNASKSIDRARGGTYKHKGGLQDHPRRVLSSAVDRLLKSAAHFGLSPSTKTRIRTGASGSNSQATERNRFFPQGPALRLPQKDQAAPGADPNTGETGDEGEDDAG